jgi:hypothetical protein
MFSALCQLDVHSLFDGSTALEKLYVYFQNHFLRTWMVLIYLINDDLRLNSF